MDELLGKLEEEHRAIGASTERLLTLFASGADERLAFLREIRQQMKALRNTLESHFAFEESCGKFSELVAEFPHTASGVKEVLGEHAEIIGEMSAVAKASAEIETEFSEKLDDLARRCRGAVVKLKNHERREMDLIQTAHLTDISGVD